MNNLKRVLSLALTGAMLVGTMLVGASAVNGKDFTDKDEIKNTEAVNTLVTLNIVAGKDDGSYDPTGSLTRAEMAKLIVYALNGGQEPVMSTKATPTYTDIKGHWAEKYIEYCSNLGIVAGRGDGTFDPAGVLTGSQAAKMMLVAMNYKSDVFGFVGADWELNVNAEANKAGLYKDLLGMDPSVTITRDQAAQLVYNGILANTMELSWGQNMSTGAITQEYKLTGAPLFSQKFSGKSYEGILLTSGKYSIDSTTAAVKDSFKVQLKKENNVSLTSPATSGYSPLNHVQTFKWADHDLTDLAGEYVKVLYNTSDKTVYGVYRVEDMNTVIKTTTDKTKDIKSDEITVEGVTYDTDSAFSITNTYADNVKFVDNDDDGALDLAIVNQVGLYKISYVGSTTFTMTTVSGRTPAVANTQKLEDVIAYEGMKKDDYVLVTKDLYTQKDKLEKAEVVETKIGGRREAVASPANADDYEYRIDGAWYGLVAGYGTSMTAPSNNASVKVITVGGKIYFVKSATSTSLSDVAMLLTFNTSDDIANAQAKLLFSDGSKKVVTIDPDGDIPTGNVCGDLYFFEEDGGVYTLTAVGSTTGTQGDVGDYKFVTGTPALQDKDGATTGTIAKVAATTSDTATATGKAGDIADDAVIFLYKGSVASSSDSKAANILNDGKVITGKDLKTLKVESAAAAVSGTTANGVLGTVAAAYSKTSNGLTKIAALAVECAVYNDVDGAVKATWPTATSSANYGYLVAKPYTVTEDDGSKFVVYPVWNGTETVEYKASGSSIAKISGNAVAKHDVIGYDIVDDATIKNVTGVSLTKAAVTGLDGSEVQFSTASSTTYKFDGNTKYLYVDSNADTADEIGVAGGAVQLATELGSNVYVENVKYKVSTDGKVTLIVVDTDNKLADATKGTALTDPAAEDNAEISFSNATPSIGEIITVTATAKSGYYFNDAVPATTISGLGEVSGDVTTTTKVAPDASNVIATVSIPVLVTDLTGGDIALTALGLTVTTVPAAPSSR